ncbi:hypothetical protein [Xanthomonas vasicola]|uniref:Uncharacterized protein n=1 Tax=Xanthomonas vasicola TaxID=56459 RepID=A0ABD7S8L6_XANVA|nr:hypothetical protein [Xanthomonas vasicola]MBV6742354.1 hypothetical protein [Xanthomonas vasicola pv. musacearum NCPPB 2251]AZR24459.1 hypothetical protein NX81_021805 [Xanthomonas vasicola]MBV7279703.1 hypothetical protein [Xanthomonas vasicola pv. musacearum]MBV7289749.1 hypothetical protein [Xanthomonas vasicola pv. musacearum]MDO6984998.1 hypothetical protein [Xanthomonas vasicola]
MAIVLPWSVTHFAPYMTGYCNQVQDMEPQSAVWGGSARPNCGAAMTHHPMHPQATQRIASHGQYLARKENGLYNNVPLKISAAMLK